MNQMNQYRPNSSSSTLHKFSLFLLFILAVSSIFSPIRAFSGFNQLWALIYIFWIIVTLIDRPDFFMLKPKFFLLIIFFISYTIFIPHIFGNSRIGNRFFEISQVFLFYTAYSKNKYINRSHDSIAVLKWIIPFVIITSVATLYAYQFNPVISRAVKAGSDIGNEALLKGIGGYELVYFLTLLTPILLIIIISKFYQISRKTKLWISILYIVFSFNIILSNYSTALLLFLVGVLLVISVRRLSLKWIFPLIIIFGFLLFIWNDFIMYFFEYLSNILGNSLNASRMTELSQFSSNNIQGSSLEARIYTYERSLNALYSFPIFGVIANDLTLSYGLKGFGQHSQIFDTFALFGIFIGSIQLYLFSEPFLSKMKTKNQPLRKLAGIVFVVFFILVLVNNITPSIGFAAFFVFPSIYDYLEQRSDPKYPQSLQMNN